MSVDKITGIAVGVSFFVIFVATCFICCITYCLFQSWKRKIQNIQPPAVEKFETLNRAMQTRPLTPPPPPPKKPQLIQRESQTAVYVPDLDMTATHMLKQRTGTTHLMSSTGEQKDVGCDAETLYPVDEVNKSQGIPIPQLEDDDLDIEYATLNEHETKMFELRQQRTLLEELKRHDETVNQYMRKQEAAEYEAYLERQITLQQAEKKNSNFVQSLGASQEDQKEVMSLMNQKKQYDTLDVIDKNRPAQTAQNFKNDEPLCDDDSVNLTEQGKNKNGEKKQFLEQSAEDLAQQLDLEQQASNRQLLQDSILSDVVKADADMSKLRKVDDVLTEYETIVAKEKKEIVTEDVDGSNTKRE